MNKEMFLKQMCNFLNNTTGRIEKEELIYVCYYYNNQIEYEDYNRLITQQDIINMSNLVENDNQNLFIMGINDITTRIKRILLEDSLYTISKLCKDETYQTIKSLIESEF